MRESNGRYKKKQRVVVILTRILLFVLFLWGVAVIFGPIKPKIDRTEVVHTQDSQTDICMENESCKAKIENLAAQTLLKQEIDTLTREYETKLAELEGKLEQKRQEELSLQ